MILLDWTKPASMVSLPPMSLYLEADISDKRAVTLVILDYRLGRRVNRP